MSSTKSASKMVIRHPTLSVLNDFVDGECGAGARKDLEAHLDQCETCRVAVSQLGEVVLAGRMESGSVSAPEALWILVAAQTLHARDFGRAMRHAFASPVVVGALMLLLAGFALGSWISLACADTPPNLSPAKCTGAWPGILRDGFQIRLKGLRKGALNDVQSRRKQGQRETHRLIPSR